MTRARWRVVLVLALACAVESTEASAWQSTLFISLTGTCEMLRIDNKQLDCEPRMMNSNYNDGRTGFYIVSRNGEAYTWSGSNGYKPNENAQVLFVDQFIATRAGKTVRWKAKGVCRYEYPYLGRSTVLSCEASTGKGFAEFRFVHDGSKPTSEELPLTK